MAHVVAVEGPPATWYRPRHLRQATSATGTAASAHRFMRMGAAHLPSSEIEAAFALVGINPATDELVQYLGELSPK